LSGHREGDGDGKKDQRGDGGDPRAEKNADAAQAEDDASDENNQAVAGVALGGARHKGKNQGLDSNDSGCAESLIDDGLPFAADGYVGPDPGFDKTHRRTVEERWRSGGNLNIGL
jgi:hypothetical protein